MYYTILNLNDDYNDLGFKLKTLKEAKQKIKELQRFDKENGNPFNEKYIIRREN